MNTYLKWSEWCEDMTSEQYYNVWPIMDKLEGQLSDAEYRNVFCTIHEWATWQCGRLN